MLLGRLLLLLLKLLRVAGRVRVIVPGVAVLVEAHGDKGSADCDNPLLEVLVEVEVMVRKPNRKDCVSQVLGGSWPVRVLQLLRL